MDVADALHRALIGHGVEATRRADQVFATGSDLVLDARVFDRSNSVVLEVTAQSSLLEGGMIVECFAGVGETQDDATQVAFGKFLIGTFHVLLEALGAHVCDDRQVERETWKQAEFSWLIHSGPLLTNSANESTASSLAPAYGEFLEKLRTLYCNSVVPAPHWVRVFLGVFEQKVIASEVLLDNEPWDEALELLHTHPWNLTNEFQSIRHFF